VASSTPPDNTFRSPTPCRQRSLVAEDDAALPPFDVEVLRALIRITLAGDRLTVARRRGHGDESRCRPHPT
jgi:hypothetical protein